VNAPKYTKFLPPEEYEKLTTDEKAMYIIDMAALLKSRAHPQRDADRTTPTQDDPAAPDADEPPAPHPTNPTQVEPPAPDGTNLTQSDPPPKDKPQES